ncbi:MAG TPA: uroporphyrinogen-III synthase, partial [Jatrophihabitantaceae bacterium]|nr:uroporphyrinogen-III synthase [Jatrophihabitantaceae bacterium]
ESSTEVLDYLLSSVEVEGKRVAVQLHGAPLPGLVEGLRSAGADVIEVPVYRWVPPADEQPLRKLIDLVASSSLDAVAFTSAPAATNFLRTADDQGADVRTPLRSGRVLAACVGPVTAGPLEREGIPFVQPERARLGALVREIVDQLNSSRTLTVHAAGHRIELRSQGAVVDDSFVPLAGTPMALLRELATRPGNVLSRDDLVRQLPGESCDGHAVEVAIGRLRTALGDPAIIATVVKRGYRLAV